MAKKMKKNASNVKKNDKNVGEKKNLQRKELAEEKENKRLPATVRDRNLKFKRKNKKSNVTKNVKRILKKKENSASVNFLNPDVTKVGGVKRKGKTTKVEHQVQNLTKQQPIDQKNNKQQKKQYKKNKTSQQSKNTINNVNNDKKPVKQEQNPKRMQTRSKNMQGQSRQKQQVNDKAEKLSIVLKKKLKKRKSKSSSNPAKTINKDSEITTNHNLNIIRLEKLLANKQQEKKKEKKISKPQSLRQRMMTKLKASRFRYLNETLYNNVSSESKKYFKNDPDSFRAYHDGYKQQVEQWPLNPLDIIIKSVRKMPKSYIIADFGCGEARLAASVPHKVHSFDFVSLNDNVTVCDMAHTPLLTNGVNVVIFCLSLMGNNLNDYIIEANRVLKKDGILKIADVESRFEQVEHFIKLVNNYGFKNTWKDLSHNLFYFLDFKKEKDISGKRNKLPPITLKPCLYKKR